MTSNRCSRRLSYFLKFLVVFTGLGIYPNSGNGQSIPPVAKPELPPGLIDATVTIKTDSGAGTGFVAKFRDRFFIFTNQHVIDGAKSLELRTRSGQVLRPIPFSEHMTRTLY